MRLAPRVCFRVSGERRRVVTLLNSLVAYLAIGAVFTLAILLGRVFERSRPIEKAQPRSEILMDYKLVAANLSLAWIFSPLSSACAMTLVHATGSALISLRADGIWFFPALAAYLLVFDL